MDTPASEAAEKAKRDLANKHHSRKAKVSRLVEKRKGVEYTEEQVKEIKAITTERVIAKNVAAHNAFVFRGAVQAGKSTFWQRGLSMFWAAVATLEMSPFDLLNNTAEEFVCIPPNALADNFWRIPKLGRFPDHLRPEFQAAYEVIRDEYETNASAAKKGLKYKTEWLGNINESIKEEDMVKEIEVCLVGDPPECKEFEKSLISGRRLVNIVIHAIEGSEEDDQRYNALMWMVNNLPNIATEKEFWKVVDEFADNGTRKKMALAGQTRLTDAYPLSKKDNGTKKRKANGSETDEGKTSSRRISPRKKVAVVSSDNNSVNSESEAEGDSDSGAEGDSDSDDDGKPVAVMVAKKRKLSSPPRFKSTGPTVDSGGPRQSPRIAKLKAKSLARHATVAKETIGKVLSLEAASIASCGLDYGVARDAFEKLVPDDPGLVELMLCYKEVCSEMGMEHKVCHAVEGVVATSLEAVMRRLTGKDPEADYSPPQLVNRKLNKTEYSHPGKEFVSMGLELQQVMNIFNTACDDRNIAALRWNWRCELLDALGMLECTDIGELLLANTCCINLSCATPDGSCIAATANLKKQELLSIDKLANATVAEVMEAIKVAGIHKTRAQQLIAMAQCVRDNHGGIIPCDYSVLEKLNGFGRKTCLLLTTEVFGLFNGIPTDKHVLEGVLAHNLVRVNKGDPKLDAKRAEACLREWVPHSRQPQINRVFGSFAQLFTQDLTTPESVRSNEMGLKVMRAMMDYLHKPHHLELIWCAISMVRAHYRSKKKKPARAV